MSGCRQWLVWSVVGAGLVAAGCAQDRPSTALPQSRDTPLMLNVPDVAAAHTARSQQPDGQVGPPPATEVRQVSAAAPPVVTDNINERYTVRVRAWVNSKAIFEDEVRNRLPREYVNALRLPPEQRDGETQKIYQQTLDSLIDMELLRQDAMKKLEKNTKYLEKFKAEAIREAEKQIGQIVRSNNLKSVEEFKKGLEERGSTLESLRGQFEREYIANEYIKIMLFPKLKVINSDALREYYEQHLNEFQQVDRVKWHDIFILVGPKHPTMEDARAFAQQLIDCWKNGEDISKLTQFDDGDSRCRKGEGAGEIKGDILPRELEPYLFAMKDGEIGPPVELATGIHIFRLIKREQAGVMPFDEKMQNSISNKLKGEMFERERRRFIADLRERATIIQDRPATH